MSERAFQPGSVVELKSGGIPMTVEKWDDKLQAYLCVWFEKNKVHRDYFSEVLLVAYEPPEVGLVQFG